MITSATIRLDTINDEVKFEVAATNNAYVILRMWSPTTRIIIMFGWPLQVGINIAGVKSQQYTQGTHTIDILDQEGVLLHQTEITLHLAPSNQYMNS